MKKYVSGLFLIIGLSPVLVGCNSKPVNLPTTLLVIDLDGNGIEGISYRDGHTYFDMDGDGVKEKTSWLTEGDGFLVLDANLNDRVDNLAEMLVGATQTRHAALSKYDSNGDGKITAADEVWGKLSVWEDRDSDGSADDGELKRLNLSGITALDLEVEDLGGTGNGIDENVMSQVTFTDGRNSALIEARFYTTKDMREYQKNNK
jgi:hypothetical protein